MNHGLPDLERAITNIDQLNDQEVDWPRVRRSTYLIHQHLRYEYPGPIQNLQQRLVILPPQQHGDQRLLAHRLTVTSPSVETTYCMDAFGNTEMILTVPCVERTIDFTAWILIERQADRGPYYLPAHSLSDKRYCEPSQLTQPDNALIHTHLSSRPAVNRALSWLIRSIHGSIKR